MKIVKEVMAEPAMAFQIVCYFVIMATLVLTSNASQDGKRQQQIDESRAKIIAEIHSEADRVIREVAK